MADSFRVEDFLEAITSQLDRTQDALALKAVNRPLTYAIRDFSLELKVFVDVDREGNVTFRSSGPNEAGASTVHIGFTTVTRPMIEENSVSLAEVASPSLAELGLDPEESRQLERLGVRNGQQLTRLRESSGEDTVARFSGVPVDRLRRALQTGQPAVGEVEQSPRSAEPARPQEPQRLRLLGSNLRGAGGPPRVTMAGRPLAVVDAQDGELTVDLAGRPVTGLLSVDTGIGDPIEIDLSPQPAAVLSTAPDPWRNP